MVSDFRMGNSERAASHVVILGYSDFAGAFSGSIGNAAGTRSYPFSLRFRPHAWTKIVITIPGDTAGTWVMSGNAAAMYCPASILVAGRIIADLRMRGRAGIYIGVDRRGQCCRDQCARISTLTGVKLEIGSVATPFNRQSLAKSIADCQTVLSVGCRTNCISPLRARASKISCGATFACNERCDGCASSDPNISQYQPIRTPTVFIDVTLYSVTLTHDFGGDWRRLL